MLRELSKDQEQLLKGLLLSHYATASPKILGAVENKAGAATFAISLKDGQYITFAEIVKPTVPVTVEKFAEEWISEKMNGALGEAVKNCLKKRGRLNYQAFELDTRVDNETKIRRVVPFGHIEFTQVLSHTQFNFDYYAEELRLLTDEVATTSDFKKSFTKISHLSESLKNALIEGAKKQELFDKLNACYKALEKRNATNREEHDKVCATNFADFAAKLAATQELLKGATNFKEVREQLKTIQADLNDKTFKREKRNELYEIVHNCYAEMDKRREEEQEEYEKTTTANFEEFKTKLESEKDLCKSTLDVNQQRESLKKLQIQSWEVKFKKEHRQAIHEFFNELFELVSQRYEELKFQLETESNTNKDQLALKVEEVERFVNSSVDLKTTREQLKLMQKELNEMKLTPAHRQELWQLIDKAFKVLNEKMDEALSGERKLSDEQYAAFKPLVEKALAEVAESVNFKDSREKLKHLQNQFKDLKIVHKKRQELWNLLDKGFKDLNERADKYFDQRRQEQVSRNKEWKMRVEQKVTRMDFAMKALKQENLDAQGYLGKLTDWLSTVRDNAATKEFRQTILDKIKGVEDQIAERVKRVEDMKENIREINSKLREEAQKAAEAEEAKVKAKAAEAELAAQKAVEKEQALAQKAVEKEQAAAKKAAELLANNNKKEAASVSEIVSNNLENTAADAITLPFVDESATSNSETINGVDANTESTEANTPSGEAAAENAVIE